MATQRTAYPDAEATLTCIATSRADNSQPAVTVSRITDRLHEAAWEAADGAAYDLEFYLDGELVMWTVYMPEPPAVIVTIPPLAAGAYVELTTQTRELRITRGDTPAIPFFVEGDYSAWEARFGLKKKKSDTAYVVAPRVIPELVYDAETGMTSGHVRLTRLDTGAAGSFWAEVEIRNSGSTLTPLQCRLLIEEDVIK